MKSRRQLFFYILLNIFISACVTGSILFFYDRTHRTIGSPVSNTSLPVIATASGEISLQILSVVGAGAAESEMVLIQNNGSEPVILTGWILQDNQDNIFTFPQLSLYPGGSIQVHTSAGANSAVDLYWGRLAPVWEAGETAALFDPQGTLRAMYQIP